MRPLEPQKGSDEVSQVGKEIVPTKEDPGCRVIELPLFQLYLHFYCPELWGHQSFGVLDSG
jgi:hypothetical protein